MWGAEGSEVPQDEGGNRCEHFVLTKSECASPDASDSRRGGRHRPGATTEVGTTMELEAVRYGLLVTRCVT